MRFPCARVTFLNLQMCASKSDAHLRGSLVFFCHPRNDCRGAYKASSAGVSRGLFERLSISVIISIHDNTKKGRIESCPIRIRTKELSDRITHIGIRIAEHDIMRSTLYDRRRGNHRQLRLFLKFRNRKRTTVAHRALDLG